MALNVALNHCLLAFAVAAALFVSKAAAGGRRLLTIDESAASVNENSLVSLWQTYAMTPVTTGDMSSIINTAAGMVVEPTHVAASTALGTLGLLNEVRR